MRPPSPPLPAAWPNTRTVPSLGRSSPSTSRSSVVLPPPFGPAIATNSPGSDGERDVLEHPDTCPVAERDAVELDDGIAQLVHPSAFRRVARFARMTEK